MHKIRPVDVEKYEMVKLFQPLLRSEIILTFEKIQKNHWKGIYKSTSAYHICPYTGEFKRCADCSDFTFDEDNEQVCVYKPSPYNTQQVCNFINDCYKANLKVQLMDGRYEDA